MTLQGALGTAKPNGRITPPASVRPPFQRSTTFAGGFVRSNKMSIRAMNNPERAMTENVQAFLDKVCADYGRMQIDRFSDFAISIVRTELKSPIEDLFYIAFCAQVEAEFQVLNPQYVGDGNGGVKDGEGVYIKPQYKIGNYRADFLIYQNGLLEHPSAPVIVELDGHDFHDKDKHQRAYEKARDRFLVRRGFKVLHFTGSEVVEDPYKVAFEALCVAGGNCFRKEDEYDQKFPLGEF